jgi:hypothetical protein
MSDADRALVGLKRRTPAGGVPVPSGEADAFTPVTDILDSIEDPNLRWAIRQVWEHTANMELRAKQRAGNDGDVQKLQATIAQLERTIAQLREDQERSERNHVELREHVVRHVADVVGADGKNGKVGTLREKVTKLLDRAWWLATVAIGGLGAAAVKLVIVGRAYGELETKVHANEARLDLVESVVFARQSFHPAVTPGKDSP